MKNLEVPDFLVIGHICHDKTPAGFVPGGAAAYAGLLAVRLGFRAAALTSFGPDFLFASQFEGLGLRATGAKATTVFENIYANGERHQFLHRRAGDLCPADLPATWRRAGAVLLGPICDEVSLDFLDVFENAVICACPQGWMRQWDAQGRVTPKPFNHWNKLASAAIVSMSENDVGGDWRLIEKIAGMTDLLLVTQGQNGATVFHQNKREHFPACPAAEVDPTGAGDIFAAAFSLHFSKEKNVSRAVRFAHAAAAVSVERKGMAGIPDRAAVEQRAAKCWEGISG